MTPWQKYKESLKEVNPFDLLHKENHIDDAAAQGRYEICLSCPELIHLTKQCKQCGCFMAMKTKLKAARCPLEKW